MRTINPTPGLVPYIVGAAVAAFALNSCSQFVEARLIATNRAGIQNEPALAMHLVDRSHKGDRLAIGQPIYGQAPADKVTAGDPGLSPLTVPDGGPRPSGSLRSKLPDGCESPFSPMSSAEQKDRAARCLT